VIKGPFPRRNLMALIRKRVLVTGGAGFLGSHLCERLLREGDEVLCVDNYFTGRKENAKILQTSTSEVYGDPTVHPQTEDYRGNVNPLGPRACYDEGKRCAETLFFDYRRQHRVKIKVARIFNTYGPRMHPDDGRVVSNFIVQALRGEPITLYGDGSQTRAFCFVDDLVDGLVRLMATDDDTTGPINIGNPHEIPVRELAERVIRLTGSRSSVIRRPLPQDDPLQRCPDITLARSLLGWQPTVELDHGLRRTADYFRQVLAESEERSQRSAVDTGTLGQTLHESGHMPVRGDHMEGDKASVAAGQ